MFRQSFIIIVSLVFVMGCARELPQCSGPELDLNSISATRGLTSKSGPAANLILPNPIEVTGNGSLQTTGAELTSLSSSFQLPSLSLSSQLDNSLFRVRITAIDDAINTLAKPNSDGRWLFNFDELEYSQTMAYYSLQSAREYMERLGFDLQDERPLYVLVQAEGSTATPSEADALYSHNALNPSNPRIIQLYGSSDFAPGKDRDVYWHEFGHFVNEMVSGNIGIDDAGDAGCVACPAGGAHEGFADYFAMSMGNKNDIGRWVSRNYSDIPIGAPLRSAVDSNGDVLSYDDVALTEIDQNSQTIPEVHNIGEWVSRVLYSIRDQFIAEAPETGAIFADRTIMSSLALLGENATIQDVKEALLTADENLNCGFHSRSINNAFTSRGFNDPANLDSPLEIQASAIGLDPGTIDPAALAPGVDAAFLLRISNPNGDTARNVRVILESLDPNFTVISYMQAFGDLKAGETINVGVGANEVSLLASPYGTVSASVSDVRGIGYKMTVLVENAPGTAIEGVLR